MIKTILETSGKKTGMIGTNGVYIGKEHFPTVNTTPESYDLHRYFAKMVEEGCECCVMEVSSQAMKMHRVAGIHFNYGLFTNISPDHIGKDEHADFAEYLYYKKQLFYQCDRALINVDDEHIEEIVKDIPCPWTGFGLKAGAGFQAENIHYVSELDFVGVEFDIKGEHHLDTFDGIHRDPVKVEVIVAEDGVAGVDAFPVDEDQGIAAAQTANADALAVIPFVSELDPRDIAQYVFQVLDGLTL